MSKSYLYKDYESVEENRSKWEDKKDEHVMSARMIPRYRLAEKLNIHIGERVKALLQNSEKGGGGWGFVELVVGG